MKDLRVDIYRAKGEVKKVKEGWDVVITIPFIRRAHAECLLNNHNHLMEVKNEATHS